MSGDTGDFTFKPRPAVSFDTLPKPWMRTSIGGAPQGVALSYHPTATKQPEAGAASSKRPEWKPSTPQGKRPEWKTTLLALCIAATCWMLLSITDAVFTPRVYSGPHKFTHTPVIMATYQWCMVAYFCNLLFTLPKLIFEFDNSKLMLHLLISYISILASGSYIMLATGFSPIMVDVNSCLYIPQRWLLYCFTAPAIITILAKISNYTNRQLIWVIFIFEVMLITGGIGTIPWISWNEKVFWYIVTNLPFPEILLHMWRMVTSATNEADPSSVRFLLFMAVFTEVTWIIFPIVYYAAIAGMPLYLSEPMWSLTDWLTKFVFASSLMEANFFTLAQRRAEMMKRVEEGHRSATILQLTKAIERKDDFLSTMSHELRTPLNGIIGLSESLLEGSVGAMSTGAHQTIKVVVLSAKRLLQLINDVLDAAKLKQGTMVIKHEKVDVRTIVNDVLDLCSPLMRKGVRLVNQVGNNIPKIVGDNGRIAQILYNLVGNAAKFTESGTVSVTAGLSDTGDNIYISVTDTGEGIPGEKLENIFVAFEQVDMSTTRRHGGTGLGLHLVKELVKAHNGEITVQSVLSKGSAFTVWLPIRQSGDAQLNPEMDRLHAGYDSDDDGAHEEEDAFVKTVVQQQILLSDIPSTSTSKDENNILISSKHGIMAVKPFYREVHGRCMILSVDDDPINQMVVDNLLAPEGYLINQAMNGTAALKFLEENETLPDLILLDVMMPDISGYEVCAEIRRRYSKVHIPIVMVSAKGNPEHVMKGLDAGSVDYVKKPFHRKELLSRVRAQIRNREVFEAEMESRKVNDTLKKIMPMSVIQRLQQGQSMIADSHEEVTVLFMDMHSFWSHNERSAESTSDIISIMNHIFTSFERLLQKHKVYRVEHTGDSYLAVSGHDGMTDHTARLIGLALDMMTLTQDMRFPNGDRVRIKIGIHCGPAYAGVVGLESPRYCVFGDTVSITSRLETTAYPQTCQVSERVANYDITQFVPYQTALDAGSHTLSTFLLKTGDYEEALQEAQKKPAVVNAPFKAEQGIVKGGDDMVDVLQSMLESTKQELEIRAREADEALSKLDDLYKKMAQAEEDRMKTSQELESMKALYEEKSNHANNPDMIMVTLDDVVNPVSFDAEALKAMYEEKLKKVMEAEACAQELRLKDSRAYEAQLADTNARVHAAQMSAAQAEEELRLLKQKLRAQEGAMDGRGQEMVRSYPSDKSPKNSINGNWKLEGDNGQRGDLFSDMGSMYSVPASRVMEDCFSMEYSISAFMKDLGLEQYAEKLAAQNVTPFLLSTFSNQGLLDLGVDTVGARSRIMEASRLYRTRMESSTHMLMLYKDGGGGAGGSR